MHDYVVLLKEEPAKKGAAAGRREIYEHNVGRAAEFQRKLRLLLDERDMNSQVAGIAEAMGFPVVTLTGTPEVAEVIGSLPEVDSIIQDSGILGFVPEQ